MRFVKWEAVLRGIRHTILEACDVPVQLRVMDEPGDRATILANAQGYGFLKELFLIVGALKQPNCLLLVPDRSVRQERFQSWYPGGVFHKGLILSHHGHTALTGKLAREILAMGKYAKRTLVTLQAPPCEFERIPHWGLENALHVHPYGKWLLLASHYEGYLYMAREADSFLDMVDDPEETFAHAHLFHLTHMEDRLDMRYFYQEQTDASKTDDNHPEETQPIKTQMQESQMQETQSEETQPGGTRQNEVTHDAQGNRGD